MRLPANGSVAPDQSHSCKECHKETASAPARQARKKTERFEQNTTSLVEQLQNPPKCGRKRAGDQPCNPPGISGSNNKDCTFGNGSVLKECSLTGA